MILLTKIVLAPLIVLVASRLATRLGPQHGGFFMGLPTTSLAFLLVVWMASGQQAAAHAAVGGISGQLVCLSFCLAYARIAPRFGALASTLLSLLVAACVGMPTIALHEPALVLVLTLLAGVAGIATWPTTRREAPLAAAGAASTGMRMAMACLVVVVASTVQPLLGGLVAGALASLPIVAMVMCTSVHGRHGATPAVAITRGTLGSIPGTAVFLAVVSWLTGTLGMPLSLLLGLGLLPVVSPAVSRLGRLAAPLAPARRLAALGSMA